jgi:transposase-like protein
MNLLKSQEICPHCKCDAVELHSYYEVYGGERRRLLKCMVCKKTFSETRSTILFDLKSPLSRVEQILRAVSDGLSINATCRTFKVAKKTLSRWNDKFSELKKVLFLYSLCHQFLISLVEGDELYTKVKKTLQPMKVRVGPSY